MQTSSVFFYAILQCVGLLCDLKQFRQTKKEMLLQPNKNIHKQVMNIVRFHTSSIKMLKAFRFGTFWFVYPRQLVNV